MLEKTFFITTRELSVKQPIELGCWYPSNHFSLPDFSFFSRRSLSTSLIGLKHPLLVLSAVNIFTNPNMSSDDHSTVTPSPTSPSVFGITVTRTGFLPAGTHNYVSTRVDRRRIQLLRDTMDEYSMLGTDETAYLTSILQQHRHELNQNNATVPPQHRDPSIMNRGTPHLHIQLFDTAPNFAPTRQFMFIYVYPTHGEMIVYPLLG